MIWLVLAGLILVAIGIAADPGDDSDGVGP
jgi:hypothetical protein